MSHRPFALLIQDAEFTKDVFLEGLAQTNKKTLRALRALAVKNP